LRMSGNKMEAAARKLLLGSRVYAPLRLGYQFFFDRARFDHRLGMRSLYASFVRKGDLVFDVGAHVGRHAEIFTDLGAKVVSIEPNPSCCDQLTRLARIRDIHVENSAAGDAPGKLKLRICQDSVISTVVEAWYEGARRSPIHKDAQWLESLEVNVVTLDQLAHRYGIPAFVKIDAEGYDDHVLKGMSFRPRALSFEYNRLLPEVAARCFETPALSSGYLFNFSRGLELKYVSDDWVSGEELCKRLSDLTADEEYGDVFARCTTPSGQTDQSAAAQTSE
jgi:FkbM family methyltransferase